MPSPFTLHHAVSNDKPPSQLQPTASPTPYGEGHERELVPQADRHKLVAWSNAISNADDPNYALSGADFYRTLAEMNEYFGAIWQDRKRNPGDDLITMLAHGPTRDMDAKQLVGNMVLLMVGGNDTTRNSISGSVLALNQFSQQYDKLRANPKLVGTMVPEAIRWQTPLSHMRRVANKDVKLRGKTIKAGDKVVMWYISGNRDEEAIDQPNDFIIDRDTPRHHLSFGFGIHRCMGNRLAEMQLRVLWEEIMKRFRFIEVVGEAERTPSTFVKGYTRLPVKLHSL